MTETAVKIGFSKILPLEKKIELFEKLLNFFDIIVIFQLKTF